MLGMAAEVRGDADRATELYEQALALTRDVPRAWLAGWVLGHLGRMATARGEYETATALLEESLVQLQKAGDRQGACWSFQYQGRIAERRGDLDRATLFFEEALAAAQDVGDRLGIARSLGSLGRAARLQGDLAQASEWLEESLRLSRDIGDRWGAALALGNLGRVALAQRDHQRAAALFEESLVLSQSLTGRGRNVAYVLHYLGVVAGERGQPERAGRLLGAAAALQEAGGRAVSPLDLAERERQVAGVRQALGDECFAEAWDVGQAMSLEQAIEYALTAPPTDGRLSVTLDSATIEPRPSPLSAREQEVAVLLARGLSNRQIAEELIISSRTAGTHVSHILNKLGLANRAQIAAWAVEHDLVAQ